jgi:hypothetical protein
VPFLARLREETDEVSFRKLLESKMLVRQPLPEVTQREGVGAQGLFREPPSSGGIEELIDR